MICGPYSESLTRKVRTADEDQILISFSDRFGTRDNEDPFYPLPIRWWFDVASYLNQDDHQKKLHVLESIHSVCLWCVRRLTWSATPFEEAFEAMVGVDCRWTYTAKKPLANPEKTFRVQLSMQLDVGEFMLAANILPSRSRNVISRIEIGRFHSQYANNYGDFPELMWVSPTEFHVCGYVVNVTTSTVTKSQDRWWKRESKR